MFLGVLGGGTLSAEFQGIGTDAANLTSYTFAGVSFGDASPKRHILVAISGAGGSVGSTVTIGGVSATSVGTTIGPLWWVAQVPTGTTGDVVITNGSGTSNNCKIAMWAVYHLKSMTPTASTFINGSGSNTSPQSVPVEARGLILGAADGNSLMTNLTWTGITEVADVTVEARQFSAAWNQFATSQTVSVGCTGNGAGSPIANIIALR